MHITPNVHKIAQKINYLCSLCVHVKLLKSVLFTLFLIHTNFIHVLEDMGVASDVSLSPHSFVTFRETARAHVTCPQELGTSHTPIFLLFR